MTSQAVTKEVSNPLSPARRNPLLNWLKDLPIGAKLALGFGILVAITFLSAGVSFFGSAQANTQIGRTDTVRVPAALQASAAQTDLLRMQADVRGYLVLGDAEYRDQYEQSSKAFEADLAQLETFSASLDAVSLERLAQLKVAYGSWTALPDRLFALRDDQLDREPAYRLLATDGVSYAGQVLIDTGSLIQAQGTRDATPENLELMADMAKFQGNFSSMLSALRGYTTTRNRIYRGEYESNLVDNENSWERLIQKRDQLTESQQVLLDNIAKNRAEFLKLPDEIFSILTSDRWREDLYVFQQEAMPLANEMSDLLSQLTNDQQAFLKSDLSAGARSLSNANIWILTGGFVALLIGLLMGLVSRATIAQPVSRLTNVAEQIRTGRLEAQAEVESKDEIGILAQTFNAMTTQLRQTLFQVRKEKKRADDLLEVVIPIGVELTTERNFNQLLEKMLLEAKTFCRADAGTLYLRTENDTLALTIVRNDSLNIALGGASGQAVTIPALPLLNADTQEPDEKHLACYVANKGVSVNLANIGESEFAISIEDAALADYNAQSHLVIPLKNSQDQVLGVLELVNAEDPDTHKVIAFDQNLQQMMESFSSLAVAALEAYIREQALRTEISQLRIEIDVAKRQKQVEEIVGSDFFQDISSRAKEMRARKRKG